MSDCWITLQGGWIIVSISQLLPGKLNSEKVAYLYSNLGSYFVWTEYS
jgi:hypothetical protein